MAWARVKHVGTAATTASSANLVLTLAVGVAVGNTLLMGVQLSNSRTITSVVDSKGNTYVVDKSEANASAGAFIVRANITVALVSGDTITVTPSGATHIAMSAEEFSGLATSPLDQTERGTGVATANPTTAATPTTTQANELVFGVTGYTGSTAATAGAGYTLGTRAQSTGTNRSVVPEWKGVTATGAQTASWTLPSSTWSAVVATYTEGGAADQNVTANALDASGGIGSHTITQEQFVVATALNAAGSIGSHAVANTQPVVTTGVDASGGIGQAAVASLVQPSGLDASGGIGQPQVSQDIVTQGLASALAINNPVVTPGAVALTAQGLDASGGVGSHTVSPGPTGVVAQGLDASGGAGFPLVTGGVPPVPGEGGYSRTNLR